MRFTCKLNWWALVVCLELLGASARVAPSTAAGLPPAEERRRRELQDRLCAVKRLNCPYIIEVLADPRLIIYYPPKREERRARLAEALSLQHIQPVSVVYARPARHYDAINRGSTVSFDRSRKRESLDCIGLAPGKSCARVISRDAIRHLSSRAGKSVHSGDRLRFVRS
jgi:hypothetical protein